MSQNPSITTTATQSWRHALTHLRLAFALVLTPLFALGVYSALPGPIDWLRVAVAYVIIHVLVNGGLNAYNSYYDKDEGPIGALEAPPPVDDNVFYIGVIFKVLAVLCGLWVGVEFALLVLMAVLASVAYSHPRWRWKERPALALLVIFIGQGMAGVLWGWVPVVEGRTIGGLFDIGGLLDTVAGLAIIGGAFWTISFYPLTGVYQIPEDARRGVKTLAVVLGVERCFLFAALVGIPSVACIGALLLLRGNFIALAVGSIYLVRTAYIIWNWKQNFAEMSTRENQRTLMQIAYANGVFFTLFFGILIAFNQLSNQL